MKTFANDELGVGQVQVFVQRCIMRALHAMVWPEHLWAIGHVHHVVRRFTCVARRKRGMPRWVPVLRNHHIGKQLTHAVNHWHHLVATRHRQATPGHKTVLRVNNDQYCVLVHGCDEQLNRCCLRPTR